MTEKERIKELSKMFYEAQANLSKLKTVHGSYLLGYYHAILAVKDKLELKED